MEYPWWLLSHLTLATEKVHVQKEIHHMLTRLQNNLPPEVPQWSERKQLPSRHPSLRWLKLAGTNCLIIPEGIWPGQKCSRGSRIVSKRHREWKATAVSACVGAHAWGPASWERACNIPSWTLRNTWHAVPHQPMCKAGLVTHSALIRLSPLEDAVKESITISLRASLRAGLGAHPLPAVWPWRGHGVVQLSPTEKLPPSSERW